MTIYVLRTEGLIKIGYTDNLHRRVQDIISQTPTPVVFMGYMPGDRAVEAHFHQRFKAAHFSGEWFVAKPDILSIFEAILIPELPKLEPKTRARQRASNIRENETLRELLRKAAARRWPDLQHGERIDAAASELGWNRGRLKALYYAESRLAIRSFEKDELEKWSGKSSPEIDALEQIGGGVDRPGNSR